ncbi:hypothetical protein QTP86_007469 [Hemibagrus guttatus]|nr:hypothetical protein QTP86_007469 [Hemibagrus guttatus]
MPCRNPNTTHSDYITTAIRLDNLLCQQHRGLHLRTESQPCWEFRSPRDEGPEPMQLGRLQLCFYCGGSGHRVSACPERPSTSKVMEKFWQSCLTPKVTMHHAHTSLVVPALVDSSAAVNLIDHYLVEELHLPTMPCETILQMMAEDNHPIGKGLITRQTSSLTFQVGLLSSQLHHPWLAMAAAIRPTDVMEGGRADPMVTILPIRSQGGVHRRGSCGGLLLAFDFSGGCQFLLHGKERQRPPTGLYTDYQSLNAITVRYPYTLLLVPAALEQLREAWVFTKLDLRSTYNLLRIRERDEWKNYEYLVTPFGLINAPVVFHAFINEIFKDLINQYVIAYINDILT